MTNKKFVAKLMESHPLAEIFIIEGIRRYAEACSETRLPDNYFINPDAWQEAAVNLKTLIDNRGT